MPIRRSGHTTDDRMRGRKLQRIRAAHFRSNPLCSGPDSECERQGRVRTWTQLDHRVAIVNGGTDTDDNRQGLCDECHELKTARDLGHHKVPTTFDDGGRPQW